MTEDEVLDAAIKHFATKGWRLLMRTRRAAPHGPGEVGGADAILDDGDFERFLWIEAKGDPTTPPAKSTSFTNVLGAVTKRMWTDRYGGNEAAELFVAVDGLDPKQVRERVRERANFDRSQYVIALAPSYETTTNTWDLTAFCARNKIQIEYFSE